MPRGRPAPRSGGWQSAAIYYFAPNEPRSGFRKKAAIVVLDAGSASATRIVRRSAERRYASTAGQGDASNEPRSGFRKKAAIVVFDAGRAS